MRDRCDEQAATADSEVRASEVLATQRSGQRTSLGVHTTSSGFHLDFIVVCDGKCTRDGCEVVGVSEIKGSGTAVDNEDTSTSESLRTCSAAAAMTRLLLVPAVLLLHRHCAHPTGVQSPFRCVLFGLTGLRGGLVVLTLSADD